MQTTEEFLKTFEKNMGRPLQMMERAESPIRMIAHRLVELEERLRKLEEKDDVH